MPEPIAITVDQVIDDLIISLCAIAAGCDTYDTDNREAALANLAILAQARKSGNRTLVLNTMPVIEADAITARNHYQWRDEGAKEAAEKTIVLCGAFTYLLTGSVSL
jgi:hypothetical protein